MLISKKLKSTDLKPNTSIGLHLSGVLQFAYHLKKKTTNKYKQSWYH